MQKGHEDLTDKKHNTKKYWVKISKKTKSHDKVIYIDMHFNQNWTKSITYFLGKYIK